MVQLFQSLYSHKAGDLKVSKSDENSRVSHWLEKLFNQEKNRNSESSSSSVHNLLQKKHTILLEEGKNEQTKNEATKKEEDKKTLNDLVKKSNRCIISISSLFPWTLFPNTIQVEEGRVTFIFRQFLSSQSHSVDIKDISNVFIQSSWYLATLQIVSRTYIQNEIKIGHLNAAKADEVRMIIEGLRTFAEHDIDTSNYEVGELTSKIKEFHTNRTIS